MSGSVTASYCYKEHLYVCVVIYRCVSLLQLTCSIDNVHEDVMMYISHMKVYTLHTCCFWCRAGCYERHVGMKYLYTFIG